LHQIENCKLAPNPSAAVVAQRAALSEKAKLRNKKQNKKE
jgi:hypothetical protein